MAGANDAKYPPLPYITKERSNRMWVLQVQAVVHAGTGENMMNQMAMFCLGERAHPLRHWTGTGDQVQATRRKRLWTFVNYVFAFRFVAIMNCEYSFIDSHHDGVNNFISSVNHYSKNTRCSLPEAFRELSLYAYKWVLNHFDKKKAHRIHRSVICHSLFWLAFAKAYWDRSKPGRHKYDPGEDGEEPGAGTYRHDPSGGSYRLWREGLCHPWTAFRWRAPSEIGCGRPLPPRLW